MEATLKARWVTGLVGIPPLVLLVGWGAPWLFAAVLILLSVVALREYFVMVFPGRVREPLVGVLCGGGLSIFLVLPGVAEPTLGLGLLLVACFSIYLFMKGKLEEKLMGLAWTLLGIFYIGYLLPHWAVLFRMPDGRAWVGFVLLVVMLGDSAAYFVGRHYGTKKLAPEISPGKTVAGAWGYMIASVIGGFIGANFLLRALPWFEVASVSVILGVLGQIGDLFESWIKRAFAVKDSGRLFPGHGGLLDRLDSLIFPAVFTTAYLRVFHP